MINFEKDKGIFNFRVAGIMINDGRVLVHRLVKDDFYAFPGGRVEMFETTEETLVREMQEELGIDVKIDRLLWTCENFFVYEERKYHEICFYYLMENLGESLLERGNRFAMFEDDREYEFKWVDLKGIENEALYPETIRDRLNSIPDVMESIVDVDKGFEEIVKKK